ncbi:hypothetical protein KLEB273_gp257 [Bacillus phage vB_BauM_KLEB27-3]|nr:hypothetical protein KLEB273_gp257 [Bacillus phage vB_BauM_KLEB27-3]
MTKFKNRIKYLTMILLSILLFLTMALLILANLLITINFFEQGYYKDPKGMIFVASFILLQIFTFLTGQVFTDSCHDIINFSERNKKIVYLDDYRKKKEKEFDYIIIQQKDIE